MYVPFYDIIIVCAFLEAQYHQVTLDLHVNLARMLQEVFELNDLQMIHLIIVAAEIVWNQQHALIDHETVL